MIRVERVSEEKLIYQTMKKLSADFFDSTIDKKTLSEKIARFGCFRVCFINNDEAGFVGYYANDTINHFGYLSTIVVSRAYQGKGIGSMLLQECFEDCREKGMVGCRLEVNITNKRAIHFYEAKGFKKESVASQTSNYYFCKI